MLNVKFFFYFSYLTTILLVIFFKNLKFSKNSFSFFTGLPHTHRTEEIQGNWEFANYRKFQETHFFKLREVLGFIKKSQGNFFDLE